MLPDFFALKDSRNWIYITIKLVLVLIFSGLLLWLYPRQINSVESIPDIIYPAGTAIITAIIIAAATLISQSKRYVPFLVLVADWALIAAYIFTIPSPANYNYLLPMAFTLSIMVSGIMYLGAIFGVIALIGNLIAAGVAYAFRQDSAFDALMNDPQPILPVLIFTIIVSILVIVWHLFLDEENTSGRKQVRQEIETSRQRLQEMRERTRALAEMSARINASLQFDSILDSSLDLGRMSVRSNSSARVVSMALMITNDEGELSIEAERGLQHSELHHVFAGESGIIAQAMDSGEAIIYNGGSDDPELKVLNSFALIKSTLVIPLRANFETYGVLVFGSTATNAINEDHIDTLNAIGVQATIALQNAVLYYNLQEEKERILRIEENGRKSLVRDLHDVPTQTISAVAMHLSVIPTIFKRDPERVEGEIKNIRSMALRATEELRHVMFTIRPLSLEADGLGIALSQLADKMNKTYGQPMQVKIEPAIETALDKDAKGSLFYLIEEAANNARKYAEADIIQVQGQIQNGEVIIRVRDNGKGFSVSEVGEDYQSRGSFGMVNMRERAELINASFELQSAVGKGTVVTVRVPIKDPKLTTKVPILKARRPVRKQYSGPISPSS